MDSLKDRVPHECLRYDLPRGDDHCHAFRFGLSKVGDDDDDNDNDDDEIMRRGSSLLE